MYKAKDFDYDLWTSPDGKCFVRVRSTGEVSEISEETMKFLRAEEKRLFREQELKKNLNSDDLRIKTKASICFPLSFDIYSDDENEDSVWLKSNENIEEDQADKENEKEFIEQLSDKQKEIFMCVLLGGETQAEFAKRKEIKIQSVNESIKYIRKKAKKFFNHP